MNAPAAPPTTFVGRRKELAQIRRQLEQTRVVTLTGPPGVGKTRLALRLAEEVVPAFVDGVWLVELVALNDAALLAQEVAGALGLRDASARWAVAGVAEHIGDRHMLLVLDNCEHLLDACAVFIDSLARTCPNLRILATSRQSLGIGAEAVVRVAPLDVPDEGAVTGDAMELLLRRAAAVAPEFSADEADLAQAAVLVRRLDGIPLAIELAAGRLRTLTIEQVVARLDNRFDVLARRDATAPAHQRTLRAALDWSRGLASEAEQVLWRRAAVFSGTFDISAAECVCAGDELTPDQVLEALDGLVDKSIVAAGRVGATMRYRMLETVREYGLEDLRESGEDEVVRARLFAYCADLCRQAWANWANAQQPAWLERLAIEHGNLRQALDWCLSNDVEAGCVMAADMWLYWEARAHITEGRRRMAALLEALPATSPIRPRALWISGFLALGQSDVAVALPLLEAALEAAVERSDHEVVAFATQYLGLAQLFSGDVDGAAARFEQAYEMHSWLGSKAAAFNLTDIAVTAMLTGDVERAVDLYEEALVMTADDGDPWTRSHAHWGLGVATFLAGDVERAEQAEKEALRLSSILDERTGIALSLEALAWTAAARGAFERAATLQGASLAIWDSIPGQLPPPMQEHAQRCEQRVTERLGAARRAGLFDKGRRLQRGVAVALGLDQPLVEPETSDEANGTTLTQREDEVAALVAEGLTDREIAARLVISQRTAESHVQHILTKLGFRSRTQIATWITVRQKAS